MILHTIDEDKEWGIWQVTCCSQLNEMSSIEKIYESEKKCKNLLGCGTSWRLQAHLGRE